MTQVKLFYSYDSKNVEECVNQFFQENANVIKVVDIKYTTVSTTYSSHYNWTVMVVYETL